MQLRVVVNLDGAAFNPADGIYVPDPGAVQIVLGKVTHAMYHGNLEGGTLRDELGNTCGRWDISEVAQ
jgi:hypothetical protein